MNIFLIVLPLVLCLMAAVQVWRSPGPDSALAWLVWRDISLPVAGPAAVLSRLGLASGLAALAVGLFSLKNIRRLGQQAMESRARLLSGFQDGLKSLPWLAGSLGLLVSLSLSSVLLFELLVLGAGRLDLDRRFDFMVAFFIVFLCLASLYFSLRLIWHTLRNSRRLFEDESGFIFGSLMPEAEAPDLWRLVREVALNIGAEVPDQLVTGLPGGFFVTEQPFRFSDRPEELIRGRTLYLPLPYLAFMTRDEAAAVIGHELAHFAGEDTEYSLHFAPLYAKAANHLEALNTAVGDSGQNPPTAGLAEKPVRMLVEYFLASFHLAVNHWRREREAAADRQGSIGVGRPAQARALLKIAVLTPILERAVSESWEAGGASAESILDRLRRLVREEGPGDPAEHLDAIQAHPTDTHPPLRRRLEALEVPLTEELLADIRQTGPTSLLNDLGLEESEEAGPTGDLKSTLESQFAEAARENAETELDILKTIGADGLERREYYPGGFWIGLLFALLTAMALMMSLGIYLEGHGGIAVGFLMSGLVFCVPTWIFTRKPKQPFLILGPDGFLVTGAESEIAWTAIVDYSLNYIEGMLNLEFILSDDCQPPDITKNKRTQLDLKNNKIVCSVIGLAKPDTPLGLAEDLHRHHQGALARAEFKRRESIHKRDDK